jgi:hypothetical protein
LSDEVAFSPEDETWDSNDIASDRFYYTVRMRTGILMMKLRRPM